MKTNMSLRNDRFRAEMEVSPLLQKVIAIYHITQVIAIIICVAVSITSLLFYILLSAIILVIVFIIFWVASKCNFYRTWLLFLSTTTPYSVQCVSSAFSQFLFAHAS